jgi:hypothetical protein
VRLGQWQLIQWCGTDFEVEIHMCTVISHSAPQSPSALVTVGNIQGTCKEHAGKHSERVGNVQRKCREYVGNMQGTHREHAGNT